MTLLNFLESKQLTSAVNLYIAWIIATLLYLQQRVTPVINLSPIDLALQAGLIYGYYTAIVLALRLLLFPFIFFAVGLQKWPDLAETWARLVNDGKPDNEYKKDYTLAEIGDSLGGFIRRLTQVLGMLAVFVFHPEYLVYTVAPIGLSIVLFFYILFDDNEKKTRPITVAENSRSSPTYVEIVHSNENPIEIKNSQYNPIHVDVAPESNFLPVNIVQGNILPVQVVNEVLVSSSVPLPVEVINVVTTQSNDD